MGGPPRHLLLTAAVCCAGLARAQGAGTDWCALAAATTANSFLGNISKALQGETLRVVAFHEPPWAVIDDSLPAGYGRGKRISGFEVELMALVASEGGFSLDYHGHTVGENESWTDALFRAKDEYDVIAGGGWMDTSERRRGGVIFSTPIENLGTVLGMRRPEHQETSVWDNAWFWVKPFTAGAYVVAIIALSVIPALLVWSLERAEQPGIEGITQGVFMGVLAVVGFGDFTWAGVMMVWALVCLVLVSSYTASLTSFLVVSGQAKLGVADADDFFTQGHVACVPKGWALVQQIRRRWPKHTSLMREVPADRMARGLADKECDGMLMQFDYMRIMLQGGPPRSPVADGGEDYGCRAVIIGRTEINGVGAFPTGTNQCKWFINQVINSIIRVLAEFDRIEELFQETVSRSTRKADGSPRCSWMAALESSKRRMATLGKGGGGGGGSGGGAAAAAAMQGDGQPEDAGGEVVISAEHLIGLMVVSLPTMVVAACVGFVLQQVKRRRLARMRDAASCPAEAAGVSGSRAGLLGGWTYGTKSYRIEEHGGKLYFRQGMQRGELTPVIGARAPGGFPANWRAELGEGVIWLRHDRAKRQIESLFQHKVTQEIFRNTAISAPGRVRSATVVR
eukprot:TRINITY_DN8635_c0_g1_i1.p1 TRINITY_DN8635_c0_g1~~TRINITY_DN8635_c0_g1_i1.p1  ORF type:complete len:625 (+),score=202.39 TRINITY_DN8635_c0_g1_i1:95-1969(+)